MDYVIQFLIVILAILTSNYVHGFLFAAFKADKYEDVLATKIANVVVNRLSKTTNKGTKTEGE